jgi:hypothetical protein
MTQSVPADVPAIGIKDMVVGIPLDGVAVLLNGQLIVLFGKGLVTKSVQAERGPLEKESIRQTMLQPCSVLTL